MENIKMPVVGDELTIAEEVWTITEVVETDDGGINLKLEIV